MHIVKDRVIENELNPGEELLWTGKPRTGLILVPMEAFIIPFSLVWSGVPTWAIVTGIHRHAVMSNLFPLLPFLAIGFYMAIGRFIVDIKRRANTSYGVTNRRIIIASDFFGKKTTSVSLPIIGPTTLTERKDLTGSIAFGPRNGHGHQMTGAGLGNSTGPEFEHINDARKVYQIIQNATVQQQDKQTRYPNTVL